MSDLETQQELDLVQLFNYDAMLYVVKYSGPFGFIKPWTAVRDAGKESKTFSQQFLTPSIVEGIRQKLDVHSITRHKLSYTSISIQQEVVQSKAWKMNSRTKEAIRPTGILNRGVMINPILYLAFEKIEDAEKGVIQHICLCRNEDILFPDTEILNMEDVEFDKLTGFELRFGENEKSFLVGFNRFNETKPMYGWLEITGKPVIGM